MSKNKKRKRKLKKGRFILALVILVVIALLVFIVVRQGGKIISKEVTKYLANNQVSVDLYNYDSESEEITLIEEDVSRGQEVKAFMSEVIMKDDNEYVKIKIDDDSYYVDSDNLVDKKEDVVLEKEVYVRTASSILESTEEPKILGLANKGDKLEVLGYDEVKEDGTVNAYQVKSGDITGYVYGKYMVFNEEDAKANYNAEVYDPIHSAIKNSYGGGEAINLDFYPVDKPKFEDNVMPEAVYSLYLNSGVLGSVDEYIAFAKETKINTFVVDIMDDTAIAYSSDVMKEFSPTTYEHGSLDVETYKAAIQKIKDAGFYVIGRITAFKDSYYVQDHPENSIASKATGQPYYHTGAYWPTPYSRDVWYYKVELAKEAVNLFGFNEIQYDYVRFPDRMTSVSDLVDLHNDYNEDKVQAIQRFVQYATDELHKLNVYVSIDVFGESTNGSYTTAYGQYWPAISNVADVISGMPYPDHFSRGYYGISEPWNNPYDLMKAWGDDAYQRQQECPTPAIVRTWIQAYDVLQYVDANGIDYNSAELEKEIRGLYDAGLYGGYITWNSSSSLSKYKQQKGAFEIDYLKEYNDNE